MSVPIPPAKLEGRCSVIYNNTLYVYTPAAFMSLPLELHGQWTTLPMGEPVPGAACVQGGIEGNNNDVALYVVGGRSSTNDYSGLQRYRFEQGQWEMITPVSRVTRDRLHHGVAFLNASSSILVYGGSQDGSGGTSTNTFTISTIPPYGVTSHVSNGAPPAISPSLLPWDDQTAVLLNGDPENTAVFLFSSTQGWQRSSACLAQGIPTHVGLAMILLSDGSKVLEMFDMSASPNTVNTIALLDVGGVPALPGQQVGALTLSASTATNSHSSRKLERAMTLASFPSYNDSLAPVITRSKFSLAQGANGVVVVSGGDDSYPLCIFDQTQNRWINARNLFNGDTQPTPSLSSSSTSSLLTTTTTADRTPTISPSSLSPAATTTPTSSSNTSLRTVLSATLGSFAGLAALLIIILLIFRYLGRNQRLKGKDASRNNSSNDKDRLSFQDQGLEPLTQAARPMALGPVPSADSLAIISGRVGGERLPSAFAPTHSYKHPSGDQKAAPAPIPIRRFEDSVGLRSAFTNTATTQSPSRGHPRGNRMTDEGWSEYFKDNSATNLVEMKSARLTASSDESHETRSDYRSSVWPSIPVTGLRVLDGPPQPLGQVPTGSLNTRSLSSNELDVRRQSHSAKITSVDSLSLASSDGDYDFHTTSAFPSGIPPSPNKASSVQPPPIRPPSSDYTSSNHTSSLLALGDNRDTIGLTDRPRNPPRGSQSKPGGFAFQTYLNGRLGRSNINSDMSWLNLHSM